MLSTTEMGRVPGMAGESSHRADISGVFTVGMEGEAVGDPPQKDLSVIGT